MTVSWGAAYPTITVEAGLSTGTSGFAIWDTSVWDTGVWGPDIVWTDISTYVLNITTNLGRQREGDRYIGGLTLSLNNTDGRFTPANLSGPYVSAGVSQIRPLVPFRVKGTWAGVTYPLAYGLADDFVDTFPEYGCWAVTTVPCPDAWSILAAFDGLEQNEVGAGETSGRRIQRILANAGWALPASVALGTATMQATTLAQNASGEALLTTDSEGGAIWCDPDGTLVFEDRLALIENTRSNTSRVTFGTTLPIKEAATSIGADRLVATVSLARAGGTAQTVSDATALAFYGRNRRYSRFDLICETDAQVYGLASLELATRKDPEYRVVAVTCQGGLSPAVMWPWLLGLRIRDRVTVTFTVRVSGITITRACFVEGISHVINRDLTWETTFSFSSATVYAAFTTSQWDIGTWDSSTWFF